MRLACLCVTISVALLAPDACHGLPPLAEIRALQEKQQFRESIPPLRTHLEAEPGNGEALYRLGLALVRTGHISEAVWPLHRATTSEDQRVAAGVLLAEVFFRTGNFEQSIQAAERVLQTDPRSVEARRVLARATFRVGQTGATLAIADELGKELPDDFEVLALRANALASLDRHDEAEVAVRQLKERREKEDNRTLAASGCLLLADFYLQHLEDSAKARREVDGCLERFATDPTVLQMASTLAEDDEQATALWRAAVDLEPDNLLLRSMLAQRLEQAGDTDQARSLLEKGARRVDSAAAWQLLGDFQRRQGDNEAAEVAIRKARSKGSVASSALQMGHAEILADLGDTREAKKLAEQLEDPGLRELLNARILVAEGDYEGALAAFDVGLPAWPNNPIARLLAGYTAERVGNFDRALSEYRSAVRSARGQTDAALAAAQLYYTLGRYREALELGRIHGQSKRPTAALGRIIAARASTALGRYETARKIVEGLDGDQQQALPALLERARIERHAVGPQAAAAVFEQSDIDLLASENETALRAFVSDLLDADRLADALRSVDRALARREAEAASLHDLRGRILIKQDRIAKGQKELDRALEIDPSYAPAFAGLATLAARRGDLETAIELFDRAVEKDPSDVESRYHATQLLGRLGRTNEAETRLSALLDETPGHASACNDLAWIIADQGSDFDQALTFAERAVLLETNANTLDTLGWVRFKRGEYEAARNAFERAVNLDPTEPGIRYRLGRTLHANGNVADAAAAYRQALASGPFQEAAATRRELATLDASSRTSEGQEVP